MASEAETARQRAAHFLALAMEAREKGNFALAELLADAASAAFDKAEGAEAAAPPPSTAEPQQPAQQQQQVQPDQEPDNADQEPDNK
jgi:hypothetical protein